MTEPADSQRDGSGRDRLAQTGPDTEPETRWADADEAAPDVPAEMAGSGEAPDVSAEMAGSGEAPDVPAEMAGSGEAPDVPAEMAGSGQAPDDVDDAGEDAVADDPEEANGQVAAALAELDAAAERPPADQVAAFTAAHETLQATLARIDDH